MCSHLRVKYQYSSKKSLFFGERGFSIFSRFEQHDVQLKRQLHMVSSVLLCIVFSAHYKKKIRIIQAETNASTVQLREASVVVEAPKNLMLRETIVDSQLTKSIFPVSSIRNQVNFLRVFCRIWKRSCNFTGVCKLSKVSTYRDSFGPC